MTTLTAPYSVGSQTSRRCPRCKAPLLTDGSRLWCSRVGQNRTCSYGLIDIVPVFPPPIRPSRYYVVRPTGDGRQTVLLEHGAHASTEDAYAVIFRTMQDGVKEYREGMTGCSVRRGSYILNAPGRFTMEGGEG
jgi:hypothetical protein